MPTAKPKAVFRRAPFCSLLYGAQPYSQCALKIACWLFFMLTPVQPSAMSAAANEAAVDNALNGMFGTKSDDGGEDG